MQRNFLQRWGYYHWQKLGRIISQNRQVESSTKTFKQKVDASENGSKLKSIDGIEHELESEPMYERLVHGYAETHLLDGLRS